MGGRISRQLIEVIIATDERYEISIGAVVSGGGGDVGQWVVVSP